MKKINYQPRQVRLFLVLLLLFLFLLTWRLTRGATLAGRLPFLAAAAAVIGILLLVPQRFFPAYRAILTGSAYVGSSIFALLSLIVFFLILTPIALAMRLGGRTFMKSRPDPSLASYYEEAEEMADMTKQF